MSLMQILTFGLKMASDWQHLTTSWNLSLNMLEDKEKRLEFLNRDSRATWWQKVNSNFLQDRWNLTGECQHKWDHLCYWTIEPESLSFSEQIETSFSLFLQLSDFRIKDSGSVPTKNSLSSAGSVEYCEFPSSLPHLSSALLTIDEDFSFACNNLEIAISTK